MTWEGSEGKRLRGVRWKDIKDSGIENSDSDSGGNVRKGKEEKKVNKRTGWGIERLQRWKNRVGLL